MFLLTFPKLQSYRGVLAASSTDHKNSVSSFALLLVHAHLDKVADAKEEEKPNEGFGRTQREEC